MCVSIFLKERLKWIMIKSYSKGYECYYDGEQWKYLDNGRSISEPRVSRCENKICTKTMCKVKIGKKIVEVEHCIAGMVRALNKAGIETTSSCCGHKISEGYIALKDGRILEIKKENLDIGKA